MVTRRRAPPSLKSTILPSTRAPPAFGPKVFRGGVSNAFISHGLVSSLSRDRKSIPKGFGDNPSTFAVKTISQPTQGESAVLEEDPLALEYHTPYPDRGLQTFLEQPGISFMTRNGISKGPTVGINVGT